MRPDSLGEFKEALRPFRGEIKGILTRGRLTSGVGNAYADEILHAAGLYPYKKKTALADDELARLHNAVYRVPLEAFKLLKEKMGENIHKKERRYLNVHGKGGKPSRFAV
jgi:formamidopyrimidine-DNA glycosylase